jgi:two-component system, NarL family, response regulator YdfI
MNEEYEKREEDGLIRVVVVDEHQVVRDGLRMMLEILGKGFALVGDAADGASALRLVEETQPDVVLMDLRMPGMEGLEAIRQMRARWPQIAVVILTTYNEDDLMLRGLQAGVCGYLLKDTNRETLFQAIRCAARGETLLQPDILARLLSHTVTSPSSSSLPRPLDTLRNAGLTERERTILAEVARGERSKEIAVRLGITTHTVAAHLTSIYNKLGVDSRASAVAVAMQRGLLPQQE